MTQAARNCLKLWQEGSAAGRQHRQSRRFLSNNYNEPGDPSLRPAVVLLAEGCEVQDLPAELLTHVAYWLGAFRQAPQQQQWQLGKLFCTVTKYNKAMSTGPGCYFCFCLCGMDGWLAGWVDGWMDGWML